MTGYLDNKYRNKVGVGVGMRDRMRMGVFKRFDVGRFGAHRFLCHVFITIVVELIFGTDIWETLGNVSTLGGCLDPKGGGCGDVVTRRRVTRHSG